MSESASRAIIAALSKQRKEPAPVEGEFARAVARKLESRGITRVPGAQVDAPESEWYDRAIEFDRRQRVAQADLAARREAEAETQLPASTRLHNALIGRRGNSMPLNSAGILRAALAGGHGTVEESAVISGRNE